MLKDKELRFGNKPELKVRMSSRDFGSCVSGQREVGPVMHRNSKRNMCHVQISGAASPTPPPSHDGWWVGWGWVDKCPCICVGVGGSPPLIVYWVGWWVGLGKKKVCSSFGLPVSTCSTVTRIETNITVDHPSL